MPQCQRHRKNLVLLSQTYSIKLLPHWLCEYHTRMRWLTWIIFIHPPENDFQVVFLAVKGFKQQRRLQINSVTKGQGWLSVHVFTRLVGEVSTDESSSNDVRYSTKCGLALDVRTKRFRRVRHGRPNLSTPSTAAHQSCTFIMPKEECVSTCS